MKKQGMLQTVSNKRRHFSFFLKEAVAQPSPAVYDHRIARSTRWEGKKQTRFRTPRGARPIPTSTTLMALPLRPE
jgi:hypothetical protein